MKKYILTGLIFFTLSFNANLQAQNEAAIADIFRKQADSIVVIGAVAKRKKDDRTGSGFFVSNDGLIITNYHLIKKARRLFVKLRNNTAYTRVKVVNVDVPRDIAVLKLEAGNFKATKFGDSDEIAIGQRVVAIGNPLGLESTISDGLISAIRNAETGKIIQISVPLSNGSSGGPLFNLKGEVIGVVTASLQKGQSLNFATPINEVKPRLARFMDIDMPLSKPNPPVKTTAARPAPERTEKPSHPKPTKVHIVQSGDTLWDLAQRFDTSVEALMKVNNLKSSTIIDGQKLKIP